MRLRVSRLTTGLPRSARDTVGCETPARYAISNDVGFSCIDCAANVSRRPLNCWDRSCTRASVKSYSAASRLRPVTRSGLQELEECDTVARQTQGSAGKCALWQA